MGHVSRIGLLIGTLLVGSVAVAQQGLIVEPWKKVAAPPQKAVVPARPVPEPSLAAARLAPPAPVPRVEAAPSAPAVRWSPPVVELTVDPWATQRAVEQQARPRWVPQTVEIVDPWGDEAPPRVAVAPPAAERSTIF